MHILSCVILIAAFLCLLALFARRPADPCPRVYGASADPTAVLQDLINRTDHRGTLTLTQDWVVNNTVYVTNSITIQGNRQPEPLASAKDAEAFKTRQQLVRVQMQGHLNAPVFLIADLRKVNGICQNSNLDEVFKQGELDHTVTLKNLWISGNNTCSVDEGAPAGESCAAVLQQEGWRDNLNLANRYRAFSTNPQLKFPASGDCMAQSYFAAKSDCKTGKCDCPVDQQKLTEMDMNHDVWSYMCEDATCSQLKSCPAFNYSFEIDAFKASAVQVVQCDCTFSYCYVEKGLSAGVGATFYSAISIDNSCLADNRWDGFGPDLLQRATLRSVYTKNNSRGISMSKGNPKRYNDPICVSDSQFDDGLFLNNYTDVVFSGCVIRGKLSIGDADVKPGDVGTSTLFRDCDLEKSKPSDDTRLRMVEMPNSLDIVKDASFVALGTCGVNALR